MPTLRSHEELQAALKDVRSLGLCSVPDERKAWDNLFALTAIRRARVDHADPIADLGCRSGILLTWLDQLGYRNLYGCDLRRPYPPIKTALLAGKIRTVTGGARMYWRNRKRFEIASVEGTPFPSSTFAVVTSMSVIEHGVDPRRFFAEAARLLRPGGLCVISLDYWPQPLDTHGLQRFPYLGSVDRVLSRADIHALVQEAAAQDLHLLDELDLDVEEATIRSDGLAYTFLAIRLKLGKTAEAQ